MRLTDWIENRTGIGGFVRRMLYEPIPGGARWRYVWGSILVFLFAVQLLTGVLLMTVYSPSAATAWSSVWYIQTQVSGGWLIRGLHHFGSQAMIVLLPLHMFQVLVARAYRAPRECNWWLGLGLLGVVLGLSLSGYLLPWDQKGYWATRVATNLLALMPLVGESLQRLLVGGGEYGHGTITRFYTLHVMVLPGLLVVLLLGHLLLFRRHGVTVSPAHADKPSGYFWPDQLFRDTAASAAVLVLLLFVVTYTHRVLGDPLLDAPADPTASEYPARPEWYFLSLFQLLKYFEGPLLEVVGAMVVPGLAAAFLFAIPLLDKAMAPRRAHRLAVGVSAALFAGVVWLTCAAVQDDRDPPRERVAAVRARQQRGEPLDEADHKVLRAWQFNRQRRNARRLARRAMTLADEKGIPPEGPLALLAGDPLTRGPMLFATHCASCHRFDAHDGQGRIPPEPAASSDLAGYATRRWIRGLLSDPTDDHYFGRMTKPDGEPAHTRMARWIGKTKREHRSEEDRRRLSANFDAVAAYLEDESLHPGRLAHITDAQAGATGEPSHPSPDETEEALILRGRRYFLAVCNECHSYRGERSGTTKAPEMFGYGSVAWIELMIADPSHDTRYRSRGREPAQMPSFQDRLSPSERSLIARWLHGSRRTGPVPHTTLSKP